MDNILPVLLPINWENCNEFMLPYAATVGKEWQFCLLTIYRSNNEDLEVICCLEYDKGAEAKHQHNLRLLYVYICSYTSQTKITFQLTFLGDLSQTKHEGQSTVGCLWMSSAILKMSVTSENDEWNFRMFQRYSWKYITFFKALWRHID